MRKNRSLIVIPALNEEETIEQVVSSILKYGDVLVVDDGSSDSTSNMAKSAGALVAINKVNLGYDEALNVGFQFAKLHGYDNMLTFDADGQLPDYAVPIFINALDEKTALVTGLRNNIPRLSEKLFAKFCNMTLGFQDPFCGLKAYNISFCQRFENFGEYKSLGTDLCLKLIVAGHSFKTIKITVAERNGISRFGHRYKAEYKLLRPLVIGAMLIIKTLILRKLNNYKVIRK